MVLSVVLAAVVAVQPFHARFAWTSLRMPIQRSIDYGSQSLVHAGGGTRSHRHLSRAAGHLPVFLYSILGGRLDPTASQRAVISVSGRVTFESVDEQPAR